MVRNEKGLAIVDMRTMRASGSCRGVERSRLAVAAVVSGTLLSIVVCAAQKRNVGHRLSETKKATHKDWAVYEGSNENIKYSALDQITPANVKNLQVVWRYSSGEASDTNTTDMKTNPLIDYYDEVALQALLMAQVDLRRGVLDGSRQKRIKETIEEVIEDLSDHVDEPAGSVPAPDAAEPIDALPKSAGSPPPSDPASCLRRPPRPRRQQSRRRDRWSGATHSAGASIVAHDVKSRRPRTYPASE